MADLNIAPEVGERKPAEVDVDAVRIIVDQIVDRCRENGQLVTIHKYYPPAHECVLRGFSFASGVSLFVGMAVLIGKAIGGLTA